MTNNKKFKNIKGCEIETLENDIVFSIKKGKSVTIPYQELINILVESYSKKEVSPHLLNAEYKYIEMTDIIRQFNFTADKDYKQGDMISIKATHSYPYVLALIEQGYNLCKINGEVFQVDPEKINEKITTLQNKNEEFINTLKQLSVYGTKNQETRD